MTQMNDSTQHDGWGETLLQAAHAVSLPKSVYEMIEARYGVLKGILDAGTDPLLTNAHVLPQGSIRGRTATRPPPGATGECATVDADAVVWLPGVAGAVSDDVLAVIKKRFEEGTRTEAPISELRRGIRIEYADENPGFHIDITPARNAYGNDAEEGHGALEVPDRYAGWKASTPIGYADWLNEVADLQVPMIMAKDIAQRRSAVFAEATQEDIPTYQEYIDANPLRATVKLLKRNRDLWALGQPNQTYRPISAIITTLAARSYEAMAKDPNVFQRTPLEAMLEIVDRMPDFIAGSPGAWRVCNPTDKHENFAEKWNRPNGEGERYRQAFFLWHQEAVKAFYVGLRDLGSKDALPEAMHRAFGLPRQLVERAIDSLPSHWVIPGRGEGVTRNRLLAAGLGGVGLASNSPQYSASSIGRLG